MFSTRGTTHGTGNIDDQRVPLIFFGKGIRPGKYAESATPADLAPTLATVTGIAMPQAEGRALGSALK
jgi:phosphoglycerol transferase MdoB-like AlkP superfamily enzyme